MAFWLELGSTLFPCICAGGPRDQATVSHPPALLVAGGRSLPLFVAPPILPDLLPARVRFDPTRVMTDLVGGPARVAEEHAFNDLLRETGARL